MTTTVSGSYPAVNSDSDATINGLTVGKGTGGVSNNTAIGYLALNASNSGTGENVGVGYEALKANTTGNRNTAVGLFSAGSNTTGNNNIAIGNSSFQTNTTGGNNVAVGNQALQANTTASSNTAVGYQAAYANTTGVGISAFGAFALTANTTGTNNTAVGRFTLGANTTGASNTGMGRDAGGSNTTGQHNSTFGMESLLLNTTGSYNTAYGSNSLYNNTTASNNTAVGYQAGYTSATSNEQTFIGYQAGKLITGAQNTMIGSQSGVSATSGVNNTFVGYAAGSSVTTGGKNSIFGSYSGNQGGLDIRTASNYVVLSDGDGNIRQFTNNNGFTKITNAGASASLSTSGSFHEVISDNIDNAVLISVSTNASYTGNGIQTDIARNTTNNSFYAFGYFNRGASAYRFRIADSGNATNTNGSYGTISDIKNKENIVDATPKLEKIKELKVRNFNFKGDDLKQIGFVAQEFEQVFPSMIEEHKDTDADGNDLGTTTKSIKTSVLVPILVKAVQELTAKVEALEAQLNNGA